MTEDNPDELKADFRTALIAGSGLGLSMLGLLYVPFVAILGLAVSYLGWRSCRPGYAIGKVVAVAGMAAGVVGLAILIVTTITGG